MKAKLILALALTTIVLAGCTYGTRPGTIVMLPYNGTAPDPVYPLPNTTPNRTSAAGVAGVR